MNVNQRPCKKNCVDHFAVHLCNTYAPALKIKFSFDAAGVYASTGKKTAFLKYADGTWTTVELNDVGISMNETFNWERDWWDDSYANAGSNVIKKDHEVSYTAEGKAKESETLYDIDTPRKEGSL